MKELGPILTPTGRAIKANAVLTPCHDYSSAALWTINCTSS
jgi:hypothetical protein